MTTAEDHCLPLDNDAKKPERENAFYKRSGSMDEAAPGDVFHPSSARSISNDSAQYKSPPAIKSMLISNAYNSPSKFTYNSSSRNTSELPTHPGTKSQLQNQTQNLPAMSETERMTQKLWMEQMNPSATSYRVTPTTFSASGGTLTGPCRTKGCEFHGTKEKDFMCSNCHKARATTATYAGGSRVEFNYPTAQTKL